MYGRGFGGYNGNQGCFGYGFMNHGWNMLIIIGVLLITTLLIYIFVHNRKKIALKNSSIEILKLKYVQGEITEEEYLRRKSVINK
jgi:putative membrane protein